MISLTSLPEIDTPEALIAVALALEVEAARRYAALAEEQRRRGNAALANLFDRLAREEGQHELAIGRWAEGRGLGRGEAAAVEWERPEFAGEDEEAPPGVHPASPYRALAMAVHNEERAFRFYSYVAAAAEDGAVRDLAEQLAKEELGHAALLRVQRRRAFHAERREADPGRLPDPALVSSLADLLAAAVVIEARIVDRLAAAERHAPGLSPTSRAARRLADALARARNEAGEPSAAMAQSVRRLAGAGGVEEDGRGALGRLLADSEGAFAFYDSVVAAPPAESVMLKAQELSRSAMERLSAVAACLREADRSAAG